MAHDDRWRDEQRDWDDDEFDDPLDEDIDSDSYGDDDASDDTNTIDCPYCGASIFDDAPSCPHCGNFISDEDLSSQPKPRWFVLAAWLCLLAASTWFYFLWVR